jgi:hypothetical protein
MTIDTLALAIQKDFDDIRAEMATKGELKSTEDKILKAIDGLRQIVERNDARLSAYTARTDEDIKDLRDTTKKFDVRLRVVEKRG